MSNNSAQKIEIQTNDIMQQIRDRIKESAAKLEDVLPVRKHAALENSNTSKGGELIQSEDLRYLNTEYSYPFRADPNLSVVTHRSGPLGKIIVRIKKILIALIWQPIRDQLLSQMKQYQEHQVRYLNQTARYIDERDAAIFWELVKKIDVDSERMDILMRECRATLHSFQENQNQEIVKTQKLLQAINNQMQQQAQAIATTEKVAKSAEATFHKLAILPKPPIAQEQDFPDPTYVVFENRFRGSEEEIRERLGFYQKLFAECKGSILDIGCGRGELLKLFQEKNIESYGVDMDDAMVRLAREKGVKAELGDGIKHLASLKDNSLSGVVAIQVVEHLPLKVLQSLLAQAHRVVAPGGLVAFETINPRSITALSSNYFRDPTHVFPVHPDTLQHLAVAAGFSDSKIEELSLMPDAVKLIPIEPQAYMTPQWQNTISQMNHNVQQLNSLLYGAQDYCLIARKTI